jgi:hypothetical protein
MKREILTSNQDKPFIGVSVERKSYDEIIDFFARGPLRPRCSTFDRQTKQPSECVIYWTAMLRMN